MPRPSTADGRITPRPALQRLSDAGHGGPSAADRAGPPIRADFSTSVNAYGPAPCIVAAIRDALAPAALAAYPDPTSHAARAALAAHLHVAPDAITLGAGATELILAIVQAFVRVGDRVLVPPHAFAEYERAAVLCGGRVMAPWSGRPSLDLTIDELVLGYASAISTRAPRVAFLCTPESPSGRAWSAGALRFVADACERAGTLLVLDQSFDPFTASPLGTPALRDHPAVLHLRSLTKDHALAGVRVGYLIGSPALVNAVERARMPWSVSTAAQAAAMASCLPEALAHVADTTARLRADAARIADVARGADIGVVPSDAHYLLLDVGDAPAFVRAVRERHGLKLRDCTSFGLPAHVRLAARTANENGLLLAALGAATRVNA